MRIRAVIVAGISIGVLAGCGSTTPPAVPVTGEQVVPTKTSYKPKHGNPEIAVFRSNGGCGIERWAVKTLTDPSASLVNLTPQDSTVADLVAIAPPVSPTDRVGPTEETTFRISGTLTVAKTEADGDFHLVIEDAKANTMIVELSKPSCAQGSRVLSQIEAVRSQFEAKVGAPGQYPKPASTPNLAVTVTGVGFFDKLHGQTGVAPNGIELHPVLSIVYGGAPAIAVPKLKLTDNNSG